MRVHKCCAARAFLCPPPPTRHPPTPSHAHHPLLLAAAVYARTFGIPREDNKTTIGAVLAVLGVNVVIASFLISAFNEPDAPEKQD